MHDPPEGSDMPDASPARLDNIDSAAAKTIRRGRLRAGTARSPSKASTGRAGEPAARPGTASPLDGAGRARRERTDALEIAFACRAPELPAMIVLFTDLAPTTSSDPSEGRPARTAQYAEAAARSAARGATRCRQRARSCGRAGR